ncbi:carbohydrate ABC transporter permease [Microbacterium sp. MYb66]|jgi:multiple sugar transport system permease protein|uniref:carbohydrate ABC transporter permease n=1 Tax=Microbacterium sp. MYb66 TaxID=1848692 RepID=UPI000CFEB546|nr:sugar ABC transporter permease [Microbacterium sp. MYb66]PRA82414.1 sugar ABC transporter permease [Microbacterium sp. MYb66]
MTAVESPPAVKAPPATPRPPARGRRSRRARYAITVLIFLLPSALPLVMFTLYPMVGALWTSLHSWNLLSPMQWVGFDNYVKLVKDPATHRAFLNTLYYLVGYLPLVYFGGLALALALNSRIPARNLLRGVYFLPVVTSWIVVALVWRWLLNPDIGIVNFVLGLVGIDGPGWWTDPAWAMPSIIIASAWKDLGFVMIILLAGLQAIPTDLYEAARVDGAGPWRRLVSITMPMLSPSTFFVVVISLINGFQVFDQVYAMTGGGPAGASTVVVQQIYDLTFRYGRAGEASALSWMLFLLVLVVTIVQIRGQKKWVNYA